MILTPLQVFHRYPAECNTMQQQKSVQRAQCNKIHQLVALSNGTNSSFAAIRCNTILHLLHLATDVKNMLLRQG